MRKLRSDMLSSPLNSLNTFHFCLPRIDTVLVNEAAHIRISSALHNVQNQPSRHLWVSSLAPPAPRLLARAPKIRPHEPGTHHEHLEPLSAPFSRLQHGEHVQRRFADLIRVPVPDALVSRGLFERVPDQRARTTAHVDGVGIRGFEQQGSESGGNHRGTRHVRPQAGLESRLRVRIHVADARVVDEHVQSAELSLHVGGGGADRGLVGDVELDGRERRSVALGTGGCCYCY